ncbi:RagB/SusD family nutrient uptake outer membrane protein [Arcticibacter svalbardensis]|nr:RagB/SusD family nutrient uptake outer membrane protein [Arcticibacter svalbardensis]
MKKQTIKTILLSMVIMLTIGGCSKDFLDQPLEGKLTEDEFYKTDADANLAIIAVYDIMQSDFWNGGWTSMLMLKIMPSDESNAGGANTGDQPGYQDLDKYTTTPLNDKVSAAWQKCYTAVYRANKIIVKVSADTDIRKRVIAEAKFLRAYNYFDLVSLWGDVPLVTTDIDPASYTSIGRTPKADVYALIESDLKEAIEGLPLKSAYSKADKFRASKGAAQALLGKVYLYEKKWAESAAQFENVINSNEYQLASSVGAAFSKAGEFGSESLFEISYSNTSGYDYGNFPWSNTPESNIHVQLWGPRSDAGYVMAPGDSLLGGWGMNLAKQKLYNAFVAAGDVVRRGQTIMSRDELIAAGGKFPASGVYDFDGCFQRKYGSFATQSSTSAGAVQELNYGTNWRFLRYADVVLMAAEANYRGGGVSEAKGLGYLNNLRTHRSMPVLTGLTGNTLFTAIVKERQLELAFEGFRYLDLVRWDLAVQELGPLGFVKGKHELLPIPNNDVVTGGLAQNPGY